MTPRSSAPRVSDSRDTGAYGGEFNMSDAEFQRVADKVFEIAGIVLKDHKRQMVYTRLSRRLRALGMTSFTVYMDHLESGAGSREITEFSNAVTTNLTSFFREAHHFDHLRHEVLEPLGKAGKSRIRVWSAGCSTGEEPYSIALTARAAARSMGGADFRILATDLDTNVLAKAKAGIYPEARVADVPSELRSGAMSRRGADVEMSAQLKSMIAFRQLNLLHAWPFRGPFDVIFCRNVLIYFDQDTKRKVLEDLRKVIAPDGFLFLGGAETVLGITDRFRPLPDHRGVYVPA